MIRKYYWENNPFVELIGIEQENGLESLFLNSPNVKNSGDDLEKRLIASTEGAITTEFHTYSPQFINSLYYSQPAFAFSKGNKLANLYCTLHPLSIGLSNIIRESFPAQKRLDVIEIGIGNKKDGWKFISEELKEYQINLLATDYEDPVNRISFDSDQPHNLIIDTARLDISKSIDQTEYPLVDLIIGTYLFDSIWLDGDFHISNDNNGDWYLSKSRVKVSPDSTKFNRMTAALRTGIAPFDLSREDFNYVVIEEVQEAYDIEGNEYSELIRAKYESVLGFNSFNFPGGVLNKIKELVSMLKPGGIILLGEVAINNEGQKDSMRSSNRTGSTARYKVDDYHLLALILNQIGYRAEIISFKKLAEKYIYNNWEHDFSRQDVNHLHDNKYNCILKISRDI
jgi:hypothetical protein